MGPSGVVSAMKKSYENNRALLRRKGTFEVLKEHYKNNPRHRANIITNYEALKRLRQEQEHQRKTAKWQVLWVAILLLAVIVIGWNYTY